MILFRYLSREVFTAMAIIALVVFVIASGSRLSRYLSDAASGTLSGELIGWLLLYRLPGFLELILPISFFLAIMLAHARLHVDNELQVLNSAGFGEGRLIRLTLVQSLFVMLLTSLIVFWLRPAAELGIQEVKASQKSMTEFDLLIPGRFQVLNSGSRVTYVQSVSEDQLLENIFMTERAVNEPAEDAKIVTMVAARGEARLDASGDRFLVLQDGRRYRSVNGGKAHQVIVFEEFGQRLQRDQYDIESAEVRERSLGALLQDPDRAAWAEIQWRLSLIVMIPILVLLAVPLGRVEPRDGRFSRVAPGVLLCFLYLVLLSGARSAVTEGRFPVMPGLFLVHLGFFGLAVILLNAGEKSANWFKTVRNR
jgi:lipopolysaccharide export system permease protein